MISNPFLCQWAFVKELLLAYAEPQLSTIRASYAEINSAFVDYQLFL